MLSHRDIDHIIGALWCILILYWWIGAFGRKKLKYRQGRGSTLLYVLPLLIAVWFIETDRRLDRRILPVNLVTQAAGVLLCAAGIAFAMWARAVLGRNWSGIITVREDHELIQRGPYAAVRHPIYTGLIVALAGTVLATIPSIRGPLLLAAWTVAFLIKARLEEGVMTREFGEQYTAYKARVRAALIPYIL